MAATAARRLAAWEEASDAGHVPQVVAHIRGIRAQAGGDCDPRHVPAVGFIVTMEVYALSLEGV